MDGTEGRPLCGCDLSSSSLRPPPDNPPFLRVVFAHARVDHPRPSMFTWGGFFSRMPRVLSISCRKNWSMDVKSASKMLLSFKVNQLIGQNHRPCNRGPLQPLGPPCSSLMYGRSASARGANFFFLTSSAQPTIRSTQSVGATASRCKRRMGTTSL